MGKGKDKGVMDKIGAFDAKISHDKLLNVG